MSSAAVATITIMFTDLVDSTGLLRLGPDVANELRRRHDSATIDTVRRHRGVVVKTMGDGLMASFSSAGDAAAAAVAIQQAMDQLRQKDPRVPAVRVGLSTGEATTEDGDWYGPPVIESARLCATADGGQILATGIVATLVGDRDGHRFTSLEPRALKGFEAPISVSAIGWEPLPAIVLPPAAESALTSSAPFVGRAAELDQLLHSWKAAVTGTRAVALIAGEPGVGKTRLLAEVARHAGADGATVLWGRCDEDPVVPYQPFVEQIRQWLATDRDRGVPSGLERLLPETSRELAAPDFNPAGDAEAERLRLFEAAAELLRSTTADGPVLLVLDDLHWAATPTLLLLRHVLVALTGERAMVVGAYRDTELDRRHPFANVLADLRREEGVMRVALDGIDTPSVIEFLERVAGHALDEDGLELARRMRAETKGNPFFIGQVLRHLSETGALDRSGGRWATAGPVEALGLPEGVREVVGRRLSSLSDAANAALLVAAVIGPEFDLDTLAAVPDAGDDPDRLLDGLDECTAARLIDEVPGAASRYSFVHALVRQTLLAELSTARRARLHRRIGDALAARRADPAVVAYHYCAGAAAGAVDEALEWSRAAADGASRSWAHEEVITIVERAVQVAGLSHDDHARALAMLHIMEANAHGLLSNVAEQKNASAQAADAARLADDTQLFAVAAAGRCAWPIVGVPDPLGHELLIEALDRIGDGQPGLRARVLSVLAFYRSNSEGEGTAVLPLLDEAIRLARRGGSSNDVTSCLTNRLTLLTAHHDLDSQWRVIAEIEAEIAQGGDDTEIWGPDYLLARQRVNLAVQGADLGAARAAIDAAARISSDRGQRSGFGPMWSAAIALMEGRLDEAESENSRLAEFAADPNFGNSWGAQLFALRREQGRSVELLPIIEGLVESAAGLVAMRALLAIALLDAGQTERALAILIELAPDDFAAVPRDTTWSSSLAYLTEVCTVAGDRDAAATLRGHLLPFSGQLLIVAWTVSCLGAADRYIGMLDVVLGERADAEARFEAALALEESAGATALANRTRRWREELLGPS